METLFCCVLKHPDVMENLRVLQQHRKNEKRRRYDKGSRRRSSFRNHSDSPSDDDTESWYTATGGYGYGSSGHGISYEDMKKMLRDSDLMSKLDDVLHKYSRFVKTQFNNYRHLCPNNTCEGHAPCFCCREYMQGEKYSTPRLEDSDSSQRPMTDIIIERNSFVEPCPLAIDSDNDSLDSILGDLCNKKKVRFFCDGDNDESTVGGEPPTITLVHKSCPENNPSATTAPVKKEENVKETFQLPSIEDVQKSAAEEIFNFMIRQCLIQQTLSYNVDGRQYEDEPVTEEQNRTGDDLIQTHAEHSNNVIEDEKDEGLGEEPQKQVLAAQNYDRIIDTEINSQYSHEHRKNRVPFELLMRQRAEIASTEKSSITADTLSYQGTESELQDKLREESEMFARILEYQLLEHAMDAIVTDTKREHVKRQSPGLRSMSRRRYGLLQRIGIVLVLLLALGDGVNYCFLLPQISRASLQLKRMTVGASYTTRKLQALKASHRNRLWTGASETFSREYIL